jgi:hypothetical protein
MFINVIHPWKALLSGHHEGSDIWPVAVLLKPALCFLNPADKAIVFP